MTLRFRIINTLRANISSIFVILFLWIDDGGSCRDMMGEDAIVSTCAVAFLEEYAWTIVVVFAFVAVGTLALEIVFA